jgi:hypothetical protein
MYFLKDDRSPYLAYSHLKNLEDETWDISGIGFVSGKSDKLIYLGEMDYVYYIHDLESGVLLIAFRKDKNQRTDSSKKNQCISKTIPNLKKLIKNCEIKTDTNRKGILERDQYKCQLCGFADKRALSIHHIVPRSTPFIMKDVIKNPSNVITLCANCHAIQHSILLKDDKIEREMSIKTMLECNGFLHQKLPEEYWISMSDIKNWNKGIYTIEDD